MVRGYMTVVFIKMRGEYFLRIESRTTLAYEWVICYDAKVDNCPIYMGLIVGKI